MAGSPDGETILEYAVRQRLTQRQVASLLTYFGEKAQGSQAEMAERLLSLKALKLKNVLDKLSEDDLKTIVRRFQVPEAEKPTTTSGMLLSALGDQRAKLTKRLESFASTQRPPRTLLPQPSVSSAPPPFSPTVSLPATAPPVAVPAPAPSHPVEHPRMPAQAGPAPAIVGTADQSQFEALCQFLETYTFTKRWTDELSYEAELGGAISGRFPGQKVVHQMAVGGTRADLVALGAVIEIKYPKTKQPLQTLTGQVEGYQKLFANRVVVVLCMGGITDTQALNDSAASLTERGARVFIK